MSRFWLNYRRRKRGRLLGAVILDSPSLVQARMSAAALRIDRGMPFADGRALGKAAVELVPAAALGRMLDPARGSRAAGEPCRGRARTHRHLPGAGASP